VGGGWGKVTTGWAIVVLCGGEEERWRCSLYGTVLMGDNTAGSQITIIASNTKVAGHPRDRLDLGCQPQGPADRKNTIDSSLSIAPPPPPFGRFPSEPACSQSKFGALTRQTNHETTLPPSFVPTDRQPPRWL